MPVPWRTCRITGEPVPFCSEPFSETDDNGHPCRFKHENRGITLSQLRDIQSVLMRACKARLFRKLPEHRKNDATRSDKSHLTTIIDRDSDLLSWPEINQHHIRFQLTMKVIGKTEACSWVEFTASKPQQSRFFVSHDWNESFRDFMKSLEHHSSSHRIRHTEAFWICCFALNQFAVDLGLSIVEGPFIQSLKHSKKAVLMLDNDASSLRRLWCLIELYLILEGWEEQDTLKGFERPPLEILTPMGPVGNFEASLQSAPVMDAIKQMDTRKATATKPVDARQILNFIALGPKGEMKGINCIKGGEKKIIKNEEFPDDYETWLKEKYQAKFEKFNKDIKDKACTKGTASENLENQEFTEEERVDRLRKRPHKRGMSLAQLRSMATRLRAECKTWKRVGRAENKEFEGIPVNELNDEEDAYRRITIYDIDWEELVKNPTQSYRETKNVPGQELQPADYFLTVPYDMRFHEFISAIEWHIEGRGGHDRTVYWSWFLSLSKNDLKAEFDARRFPSDLLLKKDPMLQGFVCLVEPMAASWDRINYVKELWHWLIEKEFSGFIDIACREGVLSTSRPFFNGSYQFGNIPLTVVKKMVNFDVSKVKTKNDKDKETFGVLLGAMDKHETKTSKEGVDTYGRKTDGRRWTVFWPGKDSKTDGDMAGVERFNLHVQKLAIGPAFRELACLERETVAVDEIISIVRKTRTNMLAPELAGAHGETPLMLAAACGNLRVMNTLLNLKASVAEKDMDGETPLHYAALGGHRSAAMLLINHEALLGVTSRFEETPLEVAKMWPTFFLGVDVREIREYLGKRTELKEYEEKCAKDLDSLLNLQIAESEATCFNIFKGCSDTSQFLETLRHVDVDLHAEVKESLEKDGVKDEDPVPWERIPLERFRGRLFNQESHMIVSGARSRGQALTMQSSCSLATRPSTNPGRTALQDKEDMMARCHAFVREKTIERGEVSGAADGEEVATQPDATNKFDDLPEQYQEVLAKIRRFGWDGIHWHGGFTMLHWAAKKGKGELCEYLVELEADPAKENSSGATPISLASNDDVARLLKDLQKKRRVKFVPQHD